MFEKIAIFILFLGPLVFFHELGHYFFARLFGVRVEVFSIGFGPKIFKLKRGFTEYALSIIPLGGYVKMFGDDPFNKDAIPKEERGQSFIHQGKWPRFWIVMGGPLANFILAYFIFWFLMGWGEKLPEIRMGAIPQESQFYEMGFRSGDKIKKINGVKALHPTDFILDDKKTIKTLSVDRLGQDHEISVDKKGDEFFKEFSQYPPALRKPILIDSQGNEIALSLHSERVDWNISYDEIAQSIEKKVNLYLFALKPDKNSPTGYRTEREPFDQFEAPLEIPNLLNMLLASKNYRALDLKIQSIKENSAAQRAGLKEGDVIWFFNKRPIYSFNQLRERLQKIKREEITLKIWRKGKIIRIFLKPEMQMEDGKPVKLIGVYSAVKFLSLNFVHSESQGWLKSSLGAFQRTWDVMLKTVYSFKKLIFGEVSFKTIGGPLAIGKVASDSFNTSISYFFQLMALISINLGILNLLPIPVLDGGHIMFIFLEIINRKPLSQRKMEIAQQLGLSLLLMLMVGAIINDFSRYF